jgi:hypothetical protein
MLFRDFGVRKNGWVLQAPIEIHILQIWHMNIQSEAFGAFEVTAGWDNEIRVTLHLLRLTPITSSVRFLVVEASGTWSGSVVPSLLTDDAGI